MKPCRHDAGNSVAGCRTCYLYAHDPRYRGLWGGTPTEATPPDGTFDEARRLAILETIRRAKTPCVHLGTVLEARPSCGCGARHACAVHGECVRSGNAATWRSCSSCPDYSAADLAQPP